MSVEMWSNFCNINGVAPVKASTRTLAIQAASGGAFINGQARLEGINSVKRCTASAGV